MKAFGLAAVLVVASSSFAQSRSIPYTLYLDGALSGVAYDVEGLQTYVPEAAKEKVKYKSAITVTASQNTQSLRMLADATQGNAAFPKKALLHQCLPSGGGVGGGQVSFALNGINGATFPTLSLDASEAAFIEIALETEGPGFAGFAATTPLEKDIIKSQKKWLPANFTIKVGNMPAGNVSRVSSISIKNLWEDVDGDGAPDFAVDGPISLTLPVEDALPYRDWFMGSPGHKTLRVIYNDADGAPVIAVTVDVAIVGLGFADLFLGPDATSGREVKVILLPQTKMRVDSWAAIIE